MIRVGILGAGIGREHLDGYRALPDRFEVTTIVDRDAERVGQLPGPHEFRYSAEIADALHNPEIDIIDICLPPHLHVSTTLDALTAGKHVICEKPLATSMADVDRIRRAADQANRQVFPVFQYRWGPSFTQLRALMSAGLAGRPQVASLETHWSRGADYYAIPWRGTWAGEMGGAILGHAIHNHDLMTHFMGPVAAVSAMTATRVNPIETEDCAAVAFAMANGALATSSVTLGAASDQTRMRFVFEHLTATSGNAPYAPGSDRWAFTARDRDRQARIDHVCANTEAEPAGFAGFFQAVADTLDTGSGTAVTVQDGAASIELVTAIYQAARTGQTVALPLGADSPLYEGWQP